MMSVDEPKQTTPISYQSPAGPLRFDGEAGKRWYVRVVGVGCIVAGVAMLVGRYVLAGSWLDHGTVLPLALLATGSIQIMTTVFPQMGMFRTTKQKDDRP